MGRFSVLCSVGVSCITQREREKGGKSVEPRAVGFVPAQASQLLTVAEFQVGG